MKKLLLVFLLLGISTTASAYDINLVYQLKGTAVGEMRMIPDFTGDGKRDKALCFDMDLIDLKRNRIIGTATDCLAKIKNKKHGVKLLGTTFFKVRYGWLRGMIVSRGITSVSIKTGGSPGISHVTGSIPKDDGVNSVIHSNGIFTGFQGPVRLSGAVDMSNMTPENPEITFDCIFVLKLSN
jgi:hypothetical protein